jgi:hypothetical protein
MGSAGIVQLSEGTPTGPSSESQPLPGTVCDALLKLERRVSHEGLVSIGGNYSVPDRTRRVVEVHQLPDIIRILAAGRLVASHPITEGRRQYRIDPTTSRERRPKPCAIPIRTTALPFLATAIKVVRRSLAFFQAIGEWLAAQGAGKVGGWS